MRQVELAIIGAGIAGLSAATEAARAGVKTLVIERMGAGGQVMNVEHVDGVPGFSDGVAGFDLGPQMQELAEAAGAEFMLGEVERLTPGDDAHVLHCESGEAIAARTVLIAAGSRRRVLGVPGETQLGGRGVSACAACDGPLFRGAAVCVVGGGDSAFSETLALAQHAGEVHLVFREPYPHARPDLVNAVNQLNHVRLLPNLEVVAILGKTGTEGVTLRNAQGVQQALPVQGVFIYAGLEPATGFLGESVKLDAAMRIETGAGHATSVPGIFAAGDIRAGAAYRLADAALEGVQAVHAIRSYLS